MEIHRSKHSGFCFGVKRAIEKAYASKDGDKRVYTFGPLIHNQTVIDELREQGILPISDLDEADSSSMVIIRSHGEGRDFYKKAGDKGVQITDATCPFVERIHRLAQDAYEAGKNIIIIGDPRHPEVIGINGWCENQASVVSSVADAEALDTGDYYVLCQTTIKEELLHEIVSALQEKGCKLEVANTICSATRERQSAAQELAKQVDAMVVIGGKNSSNSRKLFEICKKHCKNAYFIEKIQELPLKEMAKYNKIGITAGASTPETVIKEVIAVMSEKALEGKKMDTMADFMDEIDASVRSYRSGELVHGIVSLVRDDDVIISMGIKKDGILPKSEAILEEGQELKDVYKVGDEIVVQFLGDQTEEGGLRVSAKSLKVLEHWEELEKAFNENEIVEVEVIKAVKSGVVASYKEVHGFIPLGHLDLKFVESGEEYVGQTLEVKVMKINKQKGRAIFSRKVILKAEEKKQVEQFWASVEAGEIKPGDLVTGKVMRFTKFGAFVNLGGVDGLLHISEMTWGKIKHPKDILQEGQDVTVQILDINPENKKIALGLKQLTPEPWSIIDQIFHEGDIVEGKVVQVRDFGAFVEIAPGIDGLVHVSEIKNEHVENPSDYLKNGQIVNAEIVSIDKERKRVGLSLKDTWDLSFEEADEAIDEAEAEEVKAAEPVEEEVEAVEVEAETETEEAEAEEVTEENADAE